MWTSGARARAMTLLVVTGMLVLAAGAVHATVVTTDCADANQSCSLEELFLGGTIRINDKVFDTWGLEFVSPGVDVGQIVVTAIDSHSNPGLTFTANGQLTVSGQSAIDLGFNFTVSTLDGIPRITDNALELVLFTFDGIEPRVGGRITIAETVFDENLDFLDDKLVEADKLFPPFTPFASIEFAPQRKIVVEKEISVEGDNPPDIVSLEVFTQRFSQVPAPSALVLLVVGLASVTLIARRGRR
jgi:hypothetical protein